VFRLRLGVSSWSGNVSLDDFYLSFAFAVTFDTQTNLPADVFFFFFFFFFVLVLYKLVLLKSPFFKYSNDITLSE